MGSAYLNFVFKISNKIERGNKTKKPKTMIYYDGNGGKAIKFATHLNVWPAKQTNVHDPTVFLKLKYLPDFLFLRCLNYINPVDIIIYKTCLT